MKKKKYFVKFEFYDSAKPTIKYLYDNKQIKLFYDLKDLEVELKLFCDNFNTQKIEELYNAAKSRKDKCNKEEITVEQFRLRGDGQKVTNMFCISNAPMYDYKYTIMTKI